MLLGFAFAGIQHAMQRSLLLATHDVAFFDSFSVFALRAYFKFPWHISPGSYAYKTNFESVQVGKSFINTRNKKRPRILP